MDAYSNLLGKAISSIIDVKEESDINSFLSGDGFSFLDTKIIGLDDFRVGRRLWRLQAAFRAQPGMSFGIQNIDAALLIFGRLFIGVLRRFAEYLT